MLLHNNAIRKVKVSKKKCSINSRVPRAGASLKLKFFSNVVVGNCEVKMRKTCKVKARETCKVKARETCKVKARETCKVKARETCYCLVPRTTTD